MIRNSKRINPFLDKVREIWMMNPDLRFGQIISNILDIKPLYTESPNGYQIEGFVCKTDPFYLEDDEFLKLFKNGTGTNNKVNASRTNCESSC